MVGQRGAPLGPWDPYSSCRPPAAPCGVNENYEKYKFGRLVKGSGTHVLTVIRSNRRKMCRYRFHAHLVQEHHKVNRLKPWNILREIYSAEFYLPFSYSLEEKFRAFTKTSRKSRLG